MDLLQLRYFCHAASTENFAKTAQAFHVPPSNISQCIRRLETELGTALFDRTTNRVELNAKGRVFYEGIREALDLIENTKNALNDAGDTGTIRVGDRLNKHIAVQAIHRFHQKYPKIDIVNTRFTDASHPEDFDVIITDRVLDTDRFIREQILHDRIVLITKKGLFPPETALTAEDLRDLPYITLKKSSLQYRDTVSIGRALGFHPRIALQSDASSFIPSCVEQGVGVTMAPLLGWSWALDPSKFDIYHIGDFFRDTYLYRRAHRFTPPAVQWFYNILTEEYALEKERFRSTEKGILYAYGVMSRMLEERNEPR